jgi:excisionase family DNA binding protein
MRRYTTQEAAKAVGVSYLTLLRWLYAKKLDEPERMMYGGQNLRLWTKADIERARKYNVEGLRSRRSRARKAGKKAS